MIYTTEKHVQNQEFELLLRQTKELLDAHLKGLAPPISISPSGFKQLVYEKICDASIGTYFENKLEKTSDRAFPDIVDNEYFGVEVKSTVSNEWTSVGNSVFESSRILNIEKIYVLFGKLGGNPEVRYRNYEDCLKDISVTHSPRYQIDMRIDENETIFAKMNISYDQLRKDTNPIRHIRAYYRTILKPGQTLWWLSDNIEDSSAPVIIKDFSTLDIEEKKKLKAETMVFFPEIFATPKANYKRVAAHLVTKHGVVSSNLRDEFSGGGKAIIEYDGAKYRLPHVVGEMLELASLIKECLQKNNTEVADWLFELDRLSPQSIPPISEIFGSGKVLAYTKE